MRRLVIACVLSILPVAATACSQAAARPVAPPRAHHHRVGTTTTITAPPAPSTTGSTTTTSPGTTTTTVPLLRTNPAGALPQTDALPTTASAQFRTEMHDLFQGILADSVERAIWSFFPEAAYDRLKAISYPDADWRYRLVTDFELDLAAAHRYLESSPGAAHARLLYVAVDSGEVAWIPPGYCYNSIGYWHAPGVRLVYEQAGVTRSIGIASLISWRGEWYVVHLGAVLRSSDTGIVDDPSSLGEGTFAPAGGC